MKISILVIGFNRPEHIQRLFRSLLKQSLFLVDEVAVCIDGPRSKDDLISVDKVANISKAFCEEMNVKTVIKKRAFNFGLKSHVVLSVSEALELNDAVIVLEDDLELHPMFVKFMRNALVKYEDDFRVGHVNAHNPVSDAGLMSRGIFYSTQMDCWGWGTWRNRWCYFDSNPRRLLAELKGNNRALGAFTLNNSNSCMWQLKANLRWKRETWAVMWQASLSIRGLLCIYPHSSLVLNKGLDGSGTNCLVAEDDIECQVVKDKIIISFYNSSSEDIKFNRILAAILKSEIPTFTKKIHHRIGRLIDKCIRSAVF